MTHLVFGAGSDGSYKIPGSLRFNSADSAYLSRTPAAAGNRKTFTWSGWVKRATLGATQTIFAAYESASNSDLLQFSSADKIEYYAGTGYVRSSTAVFRDASAWYHVMCVHDSTQAKASDRLKIYVNGSLITIWSTDVAIAQNRDSSINSISRHHFGANPSVSPPTTQFLGGYLTEVHFIDGAALGPEHFGETDAITGVWKPKRYGSDRSTVEYLVVAGGGGGGAGRGGGGGAGGYRSNVFGEMSGGGSVFESTKFVPTLGLAYTLTVGAGGLGANGGTSGTSGGFSGSNSVFSAIASVGGGGGAVQGSGSEAAKSGGSGGGGADTIAGASGTEGQGFRGGKTSSDQLVGAGGGGGAGSVGSANALNAGGNGGAGVSSLITGTLTGRAGGGGGGAYSLSGGTATDGGGAGGGTTSSTAGSNATANTGGGGGGGGGYSTGGKGGNGGSGVVILCFPQQYTATFSAGVTQTTSTVGTNKVSVITAAGPTDTVTFA